MANEIKKTKHEYLIVNINNLYPDPENYRFDPVKDENEAILNMVNTIGGKLLTLTRSILDNKGLDPSILPNIIPYSNKKDNYVVIEGNRRITAIKIIKNIEIIKSSSHYQKFKTLISKYNISEIPDEYYCTYYTEKEDAQYWIYLRHSGELDGEGLLGWDPLATQRFKVTTGQEKPDIAYSIHNYLRMNYDFGVPQKTSTTLNRILGSTPGKLYYGISIQDTELNFKYSEEETLKKLLLLLEYLKNGAINSRNANTVAEIENWINQLDNLNAAKKNYDNTNNNNITTNNEAKNNNQPEQSRNDDEKNKSNTANTSQSSQTNNNNNNNNSSQKNENTENSQKKHANSQKPLKYKFMEGLGYQHLNQKEYGGIIKLCEELVKLSKASYNGYNMYPISTGMLLRSLIEQAFKYHLKSKAHWELLLKNKKNSNGDPALGTILGYYRNHKSELFPDKTMERTFNILFEVDSTVKDLLDLSIHHPDIVNLTRVELDTFVHKGIVKFINHLISL